MNARQTPSTTSAPDVAIVGGGVAGSSLAIALRRRGAEVELIERTPVFHDRIRGETIHPWGVAEMQRLNLARLAESSASAMRQEYWQTIRDRQVVSAYRWADDFPDAPHGLGVNHVELQNALLAEASRLGTRIHRPAGVQLQRANGQLWLTVTSASETVSLTPRLLVGADGERSATRAWIGGSLESSPPHHALGGALVHGLGLQADRIHHAFFDGGFAFVSPQSNDRARVYLVISTERAEALQRTNTIADEMVRLLADATPENYISGNWTPAGPAGFFPNATRSARIPASSDVVLIGDAAGRNDPSQGHGLSLAFHDVATLTGLLDASSDWRAVPDQFHQHRSEVFETLRQHALWNERQATETGPEIDAVRQRIRRSRELDPTAAGFAGIFATGPVGLKPTEEARRIFLGEDLEPSDMSLTGRARSL